MIKINTCERNLYTCLMLMYSHTFRSRLWLIECYGFVLLAVHAVQAILVWVSSHRELCMAKWGAREEKAPWLHVWRHSVRFFSSISSSNNCLSKGKKIFMVGWSWLCVWEALTSDRNMGTDIMPLRTCVYERRGGDRSDILSRDFSREKTYYSEYHECKWWLERQFLEFSDFQLCDFTDLQWTFSLD